jgi:hypothetical protein
MDVRHFGLELDKSVGPARRDGDGGTSRSEHESDSFSEPRRCSGDERNTT